MFVNVSLPGPRKIVTSIVNLFAQNNILLADFGRFCRPNASDRHHTAMYRRLRTKVVERIGAALLLAPCWMALPALAATNRSVPGRMRRQEFRP